MADQFEVTPDALRHAAHGADEIGSAVAEEMASLRAKIAGVAPGASCVIEQGDANNFWSWCDQVEQVGGRSPRSLPNSINQLGDDLGRAADVFEESDQGSAYGA
jgi:uncharacterized protein YukE